MVFRYSVNYQLKISIFPNHHIYHTATLQFYNFNYINFQLYVNSHITNQITKPLFSSKSYVWVYSHTIILLKTRDKWNSFYSVTNMVNCKSIMSKSQIHYFLRLTWKNLKTNSARKLEIYRFVPWDNIISMIRLRILSQLLSTHYIWNDIFYNKDESSTVNVKSWLIPIVSCFIEGSNLVPDRNDDLKSIAVLKVI